MSDALNTLRKHASLTDAERAALDFQVIAGDHTRAAVASLLTAILCERVEGFHGEPGEWLQAGRELMRQVLSSARQSNLIDLEEAGRGLAESKSTYRPDKLLLLWGDTRQALEARRRVRAAQSFANRQAA